MYIKIVYLFYKLMTYSIYIKNYVLIIYMKIKKEVYIGGGESPTFITSNVLKIYVNTIKD